MPSSAPDAAPPAAAAPAPPESPTRGQMLVSSRFMTAVICGVWARVYEDRVGPANLTRRGSGRQHKASMLSVRLQSMLYVKAR